MRAGSASTLIGTTLQQRLSRSNAPVAFTNSPQISTAATPTMANRRGHGRPSWWAGSNSTRKVGAASTTRNGTMSSISRGPNTVPPVEPNLAMTSHCPITEADNTASRPVKVCRRNRITIPATASSTIGSKMISPRDGEIRFSPRLSATPMAGLSCNRPGV